LIFFGVHGGGYETDRLDAISAHGFDKTPQIGRRGHDLNTALRKCRRG
jgi:hypothetical protein